MGPEPFGILRPTETRIMPHHKTTTSNTNRTSLFILSTYGVVMIPCAMTKHRKKAATGNLARLRCVANISIAGYLQIWERTKEGLLNSALFHDRRGR